MKVYDCFTYFDEDLILDIRLNYLNNYVSKFVIVECLYNHRGEKKNFKFNIKNFIQFKDKIIYIKIFEKPKNLLKIYKYDDKNNLSSKNILNGYIWDNYQRNKIIEGLKDANNNDFILVSDIDEIPDLKKIDLNLIEKKIIFFEQKIFYYKFNLIYPKKIWVGTRGCKKKYLISPQWLRDLKAKKYNFYRLDVLFSKKKYFNTYFVKNGGWHFTNIKTAKEIYKKFKSYAHWYEFELNNVSQKDVKNFIKKKIALYDLKLDQKNSFLRYQGKIKLLKTNKTQLPSYLIQNKKKYKKWFVN